MNTANQLCCLRELVMAKQAYDRSFSEFLVSIGLNPKIEDAELFCAISKLAEEDARDITVEQLNDILELLGATK